MTKYKDLKVIDSSWIDSEINKCNPPFLSSQDAFICGIKKDAYEKFKQHLIDATPILKEAFEIGIEAVDYDERNGFSSNKDLFEQLLNTEVKTIK